MKLFLGALWLMTYFCSNLSATQINKATLADQWSSICAYVYTIDCTNPKRILRSLHESKWIWIFPQGGCSLQTSSWINTQHCQNLRIWFKKKMGTKRIRNSSSGSRRWGGERTFFCEFTDGAKRRRANEVGFKLPGSRACLRADNHRVLVSALFTEIDVLIKGGHQGIQVTSA